MARKTRPTRQSNTNNRTAKSETPLPEDTPEKVTDVTGSSDPQDATEPQQQHEPGPDNDSTAAEPPGSAPADPKENTTPAAETSAPLASGTEPTLPEDASTPEPEAQSGTDTEATAGAGTDTETGAETGAESETGSNDPWAAKPDTPETPVSDSDTTAHDSAEAASKPADAEPYEADSASDEDRKRDSDSPGDSDRNAEGDKSGDADVLMASAVPAAAGMAAAGAATATAPDATAPDTRTTPAQTAPARDSAQSAPPPRRSAFPMFLGGVVAAGLGAGATWYAAEEGWIAMGPEVDMSAQDARIDALRGDLATLQDQVAAQAQQETVAPDDLAAAMERLDGQIAETRDSFGDLRDDIAADLDSVSAARSEAQEIGQAMGNLLQRLERAEASLADLAGIDQALSDQGAALDQSMSALAVRVAAIQGAQDALQADIDEVRTLAESRIEDVRAAAEAAAAEADQRAARAEAIAALDTIEAALQSGSGFAPALARVEAVESDLPDALQASAGSGVATLPGLQEDFSRASRAGLTAALQGMDSETTTDRLGNFLRSQIGARSLAPREGDDPDAVMSRAAHAVDAGDIATALQELDALPAAGQAAMSDWITAARTRLDALAGLDALKQTMTAG